MSSRFFAPWQREKTFRIFFQVLGNDSRLLRVSSTQPTFVGCQTDKRSLEGGKDHAEKSYTPRLRPLGSSVDGAHWNRTTAPNRSAGFDTPTLSQNPGSESISNGIAEPSGDTFALDQQRFEDTHDAKGGLGPVFNATACVDCHQNPVTGGPSQFTEIRVGHKDPNGNFVNPAILINDGANTITGRALVNDRAICPQAQEHVPDSENIRTLRAALNTLVDGFVEAVDDETLLAIAESQLRLSFGLIRGEAIQVPILEAPGHKRIGRFGWKDQHGSLLSFVGDAYEMEMGITNRLRPKDATTVCKTTSDPEDTPDNLGLADIDHFAQFVRGTKVPPRDEALAATPDAQAGHALFQRIGCSTW